MKKHNGTAIVIGAGLSGLATAAYLARHGIRVTLFERLNKPGGFVHTFKRGKYVFEASTHQMAGYQLPGYGPEVLKMLGIRKTEPVKSTSLCEIISFNRSTGAIDERYLLPAGYDAIQAALRNHFPDNKQDIDRAFAMFRGCGRNMLKLRSIIRNREKLSPDALLALMLKKGKGIFKEIGKWRYRPVVRYANERYLDSIDFITNDTIRWLLGAYSSYLGTDPKTLSALVMNMLNYLYLMDAPYLIKGGTNTLINELTGIITECNGSIHLNKSVQKIVVSGKTATGVLTDDGQTHSAETIVSAINTSDTFGKMVPSDVLPPDYLRAITDVTLSCSAFQIYLGLKRDPREYGFSASTTFFDATKDISERHTMFMNAKTPESRTETSVLFTSYAKKELALSPEEAITASIVEGMMMDDWDTLSPEAYKKKKARTTETILRKFEKVTGIPINELAEVIISATPRTMQHYSGAPQGAFVGAAYTTDQVLSKRTQPETPIKNLFLTGHFTGMGGVLGSLDSGITTGNLVLKGG